VPIGKEGNNFTMTLFDKPGIHTSLLFFRQLRVALKQPNKQRFIDSKQNDRHNTGYWTMAKIAGMVPSYC
jgi:hypothetical protein